MSASLPPRRKLYNRYNVTYIFTYSLFKKLLILKRFSSIDLFTALLVTTLLFLLSLILIFLFSLLLILLLLTILFLLLLLLILYSSLLLSESVLDYILSVTAVLKLLFDIGQYFEIIKNFS